MVKELSCVGVTRDILWHEYLKQHPDGFGYSQFCYHFKTWLDSDPEVTSHIEHLPGDRMYIDFTGKKLAWHESITGLAVEAEVFVAILGASGYTYAEATFSQQRDDFILCNRNALEFFGGVTASIMPDCLKSAMKKCDKYESEINPEYEMFARHYQTVIVPARSRKPRDKALVENAVKILYIRVFAPLRNREIGSLVDLNAGILEMLAIHNGMRFQKLPQSCAERFEITHHRFATAYEQLSRGNQGGLPLLQRSLRIRREEGLRLFDESDDRDIPRQRPNRLPPPGLTQQQPTVHDGEGAYAFASSLLC